MKRLARCEICGQEFIAYQAKQTACSAACRRKRAQQLHRIEEIEACQESTLEEKNRKARSSGMSYGQWQALRYKQTHNI